MSSRRITLVADDYGLAPGVSLAIRRLLAQGRLSGTSCLTVGAFWPEAAGLLQELPPDESVEIGLHLCLTGPFAPLSRQLRVDVGWRTFPSLGGLARLSLGRRLPAGALSAEIEAQCAAFEAALGRPPDFIDGHQHAHLLPGIAETLALTLRSAGMTPRWIRRCGDRPRRILCRPFAVKSLVLQLLSLRSDAALDGIADRRNDGFCGVYDFIDRGYDALFELWLETVRDRTVIMCHPGLVDAALAGLDPVTATRMAEYRYFAGPDFPAALRRHGVRLAPFGAPPAANRPAAASQTSFRREIG
jgi:predicted glycoside hydrolase/deacetylase ChbG (UPF0249 family)